jgi:integrase
LRPRSAGGVAVHALRATFSYADAIPGVGGRTIRNTITPLRKLLGDAVRHGLIAQNPAVRPDLPPAQEFTGQELPPEHTAAIRKALAALAPADPLRSGERDLLYVHLYDLALGSGLRLGELRALRWQDIDRNRRLLRVEQAYSRNDLKRPKSEAGIRSIPIFPSVQTALDALAARALERGTYAPAQLIFQTERGTPLHPSNFSRRVWQPALRAAKLANPEGKPLYRLHDLRHTCISRLVAAGADIKLVQAIAGHSNPLITLKRYSHLLDHRLTHAAGQYDPAGSGNILGDLS